jgi:hypothetical protein
MQAALIEFGHKPLDYLRSCHFLMWECFPKVHSPTSHLEISKDQAAADMYQNSICRPKRTTALETKQSRTNGLIVHLASCHSFAHESNGVVQPSY